MNRNSQSELRNDPTVVRVPQQALPREFSCKEILSMTWKLSLRPRIEMVPDIDVDEKLYIGDVWISSRKSLYVNGSSVPLKIMAETCTKGSLLALPCEDTIVMRKNSINAISLVKIRQL